MPTYSLRADNTSSCRLHCQDKAARNYLVKKVCVFPLMVIGFVLVLSSGCTSWRDYFHNGFKVGPNYCKPAVPVASEWIDASDPNVNSGPADIMAWWRTFNDPTLDSLIYTAYRQNLSLRVAGARILEARAMRGIVAGELFPQSQEAFGSYTRTNSSLNSPKASPNPYFGEWQTGVGLAWELDFWGRFRRALEAADANLDASIEHYDEVLVLLLSEVAQTYVDIRTTEQRLEYAKKNVETQQGSLNIAEVKYREGATTKLDVTQGQSNLSQTSAFIPRFETARRRSANQLCILLGIPPRSIDGILGGKQPIPSAPPTVAIGVPAELIRRRPDIRRAEREVAAQSAMIGVATSDLYPHFSINGTIFFDAAKFQDLFNAKSFAGSVGPSFNWNILNYGRLVNNIRVQDARFQQLVYQYQNTVLQANAEAENSLVGFLKAQQSVKYLTTSTNAANESLGLVRDQYNAGKTDFNRVLNVEQSLTQQQDQLAIAQGDVANNLVSLYKALGGGWQIRLENSPVPSPTMPQPGNQGPTPAPAEIPQPKEGIMER